MARFVRLIRPRRLGLRFVDPRLQEQFRDYLMLIAGARNTREAQRNDRDGGETAAVWFGRATWCRRLFGKAATGSIFDAER